jgi:putative transposase
LAPNARKIKKCRGQFGDTWYMDEVYIVTARGGRLYLWRALDQGGDVLDILVQEKPKQSQRTGTLKEAKGQALLKKKKPKDRHS